MAEFKRGQKHQTYKQDTKPLIAPELAVTELMVLDPDPDEAVEDSTQEQEPISVISSGDGYSSPPPVQPLAGFIKNDIEHETFPTQEGIRIMMDEPENGWNHIESASRNGMPIRLSRVPDGGGVMGYWKRTRAFHSKRWNETGCWCDFVTHGQLSFEPLFWKPRFD